MKLTMRALSFAFCLLYALSAFDVFASDPKEFLEEDPIPQKPKQLGVMGYLQLMWNFPPKERSNGADFTQILPSEASLHKETEEESEGVDFTQVLYDELSLHIFGYFTTLKEVKPLKLVSRKFHTLANHQQTLNPIFFSKDPHLSPSVLFGELPPETYFTRCQEVYKLFSKEENKELSPAFAGLKGSWKNLESLMETLIPLSRPYMQNATESQKAVAQICVPLTPKEIRTRAASIQGGLISEYAKKETNVQNMLAAFPLPSQKLKGILSLTEGMYPNHPINFLETYKDASLEKIRHIQTLLLTKTNRGSCFKKTFLDLCADKSAELLEKCATIVDSGVTEKTLEKLFAFCKDRSLERIQELKPHIFRKGLDHCGYFEDLVDCFELADFMDQKKLAAISTGFMSNLSWESYKTILEDFKPLELPKIQYIISVLQDPSLWNFKQIPRGGFGDAKLAKALAPLSIEKIKAILELRKNVTRRDFYEWEDLIPLAADISLEAFQHIKPLILTHDSHSDLIVDSLKAVFSVGKFLSPERIDELAPSLKGMTGHQRALMVQFLAPLDRQKTHLILSFLTENPEGSLRLRIAEKAIALSTEILEEFKPFAAKVDSKSWNKIFEASQWASLQKIKKAKENLLTDAMKGQDFALVFEAVPSLSMKTIETLSSFFPEKTEGWQRSILIKARASRFPEEIREIQELFNTKKMDREELKGFMEASVKFYPKELKKYKSFFPEIDISPYTHALLLTALYPSVHNTARWKLEEDPFKDLRKTYNAVLSKNFGQRIEGYGERVGRLEQVLDRFGRPLEYLVKEILKTPPPPGSMNMEKTAHIFATRAIEGETPSKEWDRECECDRLLDDTRN